MIARRAGEDDPCLVMSGGEGGLELGEQAATAGDAQDHASGFAEYLAVCGDGNAGLVDVAGEEREEPFLEVGRKFQGPAEGVDVPAQDSLVG
ncbi:hypothetical protein ACA910_004767 [Epithemia clementina (nom. ined.)]